MSRPSLPPGFRFHPTDEELVIHYLRNRASSRPCPVSIIAEIDIYKFDPWDLPTKAMFGDREWYFFSPRDRKYPNGVRPNRAAASGYWKATGTDKPIVSSGVNVGVKKALVFYKGKPPKGQKTNWIMHEYRLTENKNSNCKKLLMTTMRFKDFPMRLDDWVLCRIYKKSNHSHSSSTVSSLMSDNHQEHLQEDYSNAAVLDYHHQQLMRPNKYCSSSKSLDDTDFSVMSYLLDNPSNFLINPDYLGNGLLANVHTSFSNQPHTNSGSSSSSENNNNIVSYCTNYLVELQQQQQQVSHSVPELLSFSVAEKSHQQQQHYNLTNQSGISDSYVSQYKSNNNLQLQPLLTVNNIYQKH